MKDYFNAIEEVISVLSKSAGFTKHGSDTGGNREQILIDVLNKHLPDRLKAIAGGVVINLEDERSQQIDIIIKNDLFPRFQQHGKTCVITESVAGAISVKSHLDKNALEECIENVASLPQFTDQTLSLTNTSVIREGVQEQFIQNWPFRAIYAYDSIDPDTIYKHALGYYNAHRERVHSFPDMIAVNKKICIRFLRERGELSTGEKLPPNYLNPLLLTEDTQGYSIAGMITILSNYVAYMHYMKPDFSPYVDRAFCSRPALPSDTVETNEVLSASPGG